MAACGFIYRSQLSTNGTFTSPNYPGFYPRNTECHYLFYGMDKERVHITFRQFEVEGMTRSVVDGQVARARLDQLLTPLPQTCAALINVADAAILLRQNVVSSRWRNKNQNVGVGVLNVRLKKTR